MPGFNPLVNKDLSLSDLLGVSVFVNTAVSSLKRKIKINEINDNCENESNVSYFTKL